MRGAVVRRGARQEPLAATCCRRTPDDGEAAGDRVDVARARPRGRLPARRDRAALLPGADTRARAGAASRPPVAARPARRGGRRNPSIPPATSSGVAPMNQTSCAPLVVPSFPGPAAPAEARRARRRRYPARRRPRAASAMMNAGPGGSRPAVTMRVLQHHFSFGAAHLVDEARQHALAAVGERRERGDQLERDHVRRAEEAGGYAGMIVADPASVRRLGHRLIPTRCAERDRGAVRGDAQRLAQVERPSPATWPSAGAYVGGSWRRVEQRRDRHPPATAAAQTNALNVDPGCRRAWVTRSNSESAVVAPSDQRADVAGLRVERDEEALQALLRLAVALLARRACRALRTRRGDLLRQLLLRGVLQRRVQRRPHPQPLRLGVVAEPLVELAPHRRDEPRARRPPAPAGLSRSASCAPIASSFAEITFALAISERTRLRRLTAGPGSGAGRSSTAPWGARRAGRPGRASGLARCGPEVAARGGFHAVVPVPQVDAVQVVARGSAPW